MVNGGAGLGHQASSVTAIGRLRELGYDGTIQVVYDTKYIGDNLAILMPEFSSSEIRDRNKIIFQKVRRIDDCPELPFAPLVITGAHDESEDLQGLANAKYNGGIYINLQPTDRQDLPRWLEGLADEKPVPLAKDAALVCFEQPDSHHNDEIEEKYRTDPRLSSLGKFMESVIDRHELDHDIEFQSIYGLYGADAYPPVKDPISGEMVRRFVDPVDELKALTAGLSKAQEEFKKPVVLLVHSKLDDETYARLIEHTQEQLTAGERQGRVILARNAVHAQTFLAPGKLDPHDILICRADSLPKISFEALLLASSLPPVAESSNTTDLLEANQKPFIHGGTPNRTIPLIPDKFFVEQGVDPKLQKLHIKACNALEKGLDDAEHSDTLAKFYLDCMKGAMADYFQARLVYFKEKEDLMGTALLHASKKGLYNETTVVPVYVSQISKLLASADPISEPDLNRMQLLLERLSMLQPKKKSTLDPGVIQAMKSEFNQLCIAAIKKCAKEEKNEMAASAINGFLPATARLNTRQIREIFHAQPAESAQPSATLGASRADSPGASDTASFSPPEKKHYESSLWKPPIGATPAGRDAPQTATAPSTLPTPTTSPAKKT
jgi:hypothetical protein